MQKGINNTDLHGCSCHSAPPCSFCTDTFECDMCGDRNYSRGDGEMNDTDLGFLCATCIEENKTFVSKTGAVYQGGNLIGKLIPKVKIV